MLDQHVSLERSQHGRSKSSFQLWSGLPPRTLIWIKHRRRRPAIVTGVNAARMTRRPWSCVPRRVVVTGCYLPLG
jgi:hypothetical protein